jgi:hypothetical protein
MGAEGGTRDRQITILGQVACLVCCARRVRARAENRIRVGVVW